MFLYLIIGVLIGGAYSTFMDYRKILEYKKEINNLRAKYEPWKKLEDIID